MRSLYIVPTRGRPENVARLMRAVDATIGNTDTRFVFCVDDDDPRLMDYYDVVSETRWRDRFRLVQNARMSIVDIMNTVARANTPTHQRWIDVFGFMGDDHVPRTSEWDVTLGALAQGIRGIAYGNDLIQGANLPTAVALDARIVETLGFMAPPMLTHLYVDNFWKDLGIALNALGYCSDVILEHMHPVAGKSDWDDGYKRVNDGSMYVRDAEAYTVYQRVNFASDVSRVIAARSAW